MKLVSINLGKVAPLFVNAGGRNQSVSSAIRKQAVQGPIQLARLGLVGDEQADLTVHGGLDKAVYVYPQEHYSFWMEQRAAAIKQGLELLPGAMGENLSTLGLLESELWVGDTLEIGDLLLKVSEPRAPCFKFAALMGYPAAVKQMLQSGFTGVYFSVERSAWIETGMPMRLHAGPREVSIASINERRRKGRQQDLFP